MFTDRFLAVLFLSTKAFSQTDEEIKGLTTFRKPADAPQAVILGVFHSHNPGTETAGPNDRILLITGLGHKPILRQLLRQLVKESARMKLVAVIGYLGK